MALVPPGWKHRKRLVIAAIIVLLYIAIGSFLSRGHIISAPNSYASCTQAGFPFTDTNPPSCSDGHHTFVGPVASPTPFQAPVSSINFNVLVGGDSKGKYPASQQVIQDQASWVSYWARVHSGLATTPPLIPVDFAVSDVAALSLGPEPTTGYSLEVSAINGSTQGSTVYVTQTVPTVTCKVSYTATDPYYMVKTPKLVLPVTFSVTKTYHQC